MRRRLLNLLTALSLLLCVAAVALWGRSRYYVADRLGCGRVAVDGAVATSYFVHLTSDAGTLLVGLNRVQLPPSRFPMPPSRWSFTWDTSAPEGINAGDSLVERAGFSFDRSTDPATGAGAAAGSSDLIEITAPHWAVALGAAILPAFRGARRRRRRRREGASLCPRCGYDLRATPGRCPECGLVM